MDKRKERYLKKEWVHTGLVLDIHLHPRDEDEKKNRAICQHCFKKKIRYVHIIVNKKDNEELEVGCECVGHLTKNYNQAKDLEQSRKNMSNGQISFRKKGWIEKNKNLYFLKIKNGFYIYIVKTPKQKYLIRFKNKEYGPYNSFEEAQDNGYIIIKHR